VDNDDSGLAILQSAILKDVGNRIGCDSNCKEQDVDHDSFFRLGMNPYASSRYGLEASAATNDLFSLAGGADSRFVCGGRGVMSAANANVERFELRPRGPIESRRRSKMFRRNAMIYSIAGTAFSGCDSAGWRRQRSPTPARCRNGEDPVLRIVVETPEHAPLWKPPSERRSRPGRGSSRNCCGRTRRWAL